MGGKRGIHLRSRRSDLTACIVAITLVAVVPAAFGVYMRVYCVLCVSVRACVCVPVCLCLCLCVCVLCVRGYNQHAPTTLSFSSTSIPRFGFMQNSFKHKMHVLLSQPAYALAIPLPFPSCFARRYRVRKHLPGTLCVCVCVCVCETNFEGTVCKETRD